MSDKDILIFTTIGDRDLAEEMISELLELDLIISGTIFPEVELMYRWEGKITVDTENKILLKTKESNASKIEGYIMKKHPYMAPEIIQWEVIFGSPTYKAFVQNKLKNLEP